MKNLTNKTVTIEGVAILFNDIVYSLPKPYRHHHIIRLLIHERTVRDWKYNNHRGVEGFLTSEGNFVNRYEALDIFIAAKQEFIDPYIYSSGLYSENCWGTPGKWNGEPGSQERQIFEYNENPEVIESLLKIKRNKMFPFRKIKINTVNVVITLAARDLLSTNIAQKAITSEDKEEIENTEKRPKNKPKYRDTLPKMKRRW